MVVGSAAAACAGLAEIAAGYVADLRQLSAGDRGYLAAVIARRLDRPEAFVVTLRDRPVYFVAEVELAGAPPSCAVVIGATPAIAWARAGAPLVVDDPP